MSVDSIDEQRPATEPLQPALPLRLPASLVEPRKAASRALWRMSADERRAAMWRGELRLQQLTEWSRRRPDEVPRLGGEFAYIAVMTPEWAEAEDPPTCRESGRSIPDCSCRACHDALIATLERVDRGELPRLGGP